MIHPGGHHNSRMSWRKAAEMTSKDRFGPDDSVKLRTHSQTHLEVWCFPTVSNYGGLWTPQSPQEMWWHLEPNHNKITLIFWSEVGLIFLFLKCFQTSHQNSATSRRNSEICDLHMHTVGCDLQFTDYRQKKESTFYCLRVLGRKMKCIQYTLETACQSDEPNS